MLSQDATHESPPVAAESVGSVGSGPVELEPKLARTFNRSALVMVSAKSLLVGSAWAQDDAADEEEEVFTLSPFEVSSAGSTGYSVKDTLAGARIRTSLKDTPSSLSVITSQFLEDTNVNNAEDLLVYTMNTEVAGLNGTFSGMTSRGLGISSDEGARWNNPGGINRARGLTAMDSTRNYFQSDIPWDGYNIDRVDISRGPNSFLFGTGSPSGISNVSTRDAIFDDLGSIQLNYGSYGSTRVSIDLNKQVTEEFAVRVDAVVSKTKYQQKPAFADSKRQYIALRYEPNFLKTDSAYTKIQANYEHGENDSRYPRTIPPMDYITGFLNDPTGSATGYNAWTYAMNTDTGTNDNESAWTSAGSLAGNAWGWGNGTPQFYYDAATGTLLDAGQASFSTPNGNGFGAKENTYQVHTVGYNAYAKTMNYRYRAAHDDADGGDFAGARRGTVRYYDQTLSDPSVFDFYNKLIDGDNKAEWQNWDAYSARIEQGLFDNRLSLQLAYDHQELNNGDWGMLGTPAIVMDLDRYKLKNPTWLPGAIENPNLGRPAVFGGQGHNNFRSSTRDNYQVTASYHMDFADDFGADGTWAKLLGKLDFTLLGGRYEKSSESRSYKLNGVDPQYKILVGDKNNPYPTDNSYNWTAYLGPSLLGTSGSGANLSGLETRMTPPGAFPYTVYSKEWTATGVDPAAEWVHSSWDGTEVTQTQAENPANYKGYYRAILPTIYGDSLPDELGTGGSKAKDRLTSQAFLYQGHLWDDTIVPSFGYREDETVQRSIQASAFRGDDDVLHFDYDITNPPETATTRSTSYGVALHLPKSIKERLPSGTDISLYYFHGENETPKVRYAINGTVLPNETGQTDDYSLQFDGMNGRVTARLTYFTTKNQHSPASVGQPLGTYAIDALPTWTLMLHAYSMAHQALPKDEDGYYILPSSNWDSWTKEGWANWPYGWMSEHPEEAALANQDMMTKFTELYPQSYWDAYGYNVDVAAIKAGDWSHVVKGTDYPYFPSQLGGNGGTINGIYPTIDQDLESTGYELEVTLRPVDGWDITFNGSKVDATQTGLGQAAQDQLQGMADLFLGSGVQYAGIWGTYEGAKNMFLTDLWAPYLTQVALIGSDQPEMRKYRFNVVSNYQFKDGWTKGLNVGGAYRWEDKAILSYGAHETEIYGEKVYITDVNQPYYGKSNQHLDLWAGYSHALNDKVDWKVQFNVRNVGESTHLTTVAYQPNGDIGQQRIQTGAEYNLSLKFSY